MTHDDEQRLIRQIRDIDASLSPENLYCDGEADPEWARKQGRKLEAERARLVKKLGREPNRRELYNY
jgi:hypothetical protein